MQQSAGNPGGFPAQRGGGAQGPWPSQLRSSRGFEAGGNQVGNHTEPPGFLHLTLLHREGPGASLEPAMPASAVGKGSHLPVSGWEGSQSHCQLGCCSHCLETPRQLFLGGLSLQVRGPRTTSCKQSRALGKVLWLAVI